MPKKPAKIKAKSKYVDEYRKERKRVRDFISRARRKGEIIPSDALPPIPKRITQGSINRLKKLTAKALHEKAITYINTVTGEVLPEGSTVVKQRREIKKSKEKREKRDLEKELEELKKKMKELEKENEKLKKELKKKKDKEDPEEPEDRGFHGEPEDRGFHGEPEKPEEPTDEPVDIDTKVYETIMDYIDQWEPLSKWSPSLAAAKEDDVNVLRSILDGAIKSEGFDTVMKRLNAHAAEVADLTERILYAYGPGESYDAGVAMVQECLTQFTEILYGGMVDSERAREIVDSADEHRNADRRVVE